jgi:hypothetical protein
VSITCINFNEPIGKHSNQRPHKILQDDAIRDIKSKISKNLPSGSSKKYFAQFLFFLPSIDSYSILSAYINYYRIASILSVP